MGQRHLIIHGKSIHPITPQASIRKRVIEFGITVVQRIRDHPNDRYGEIAYLEQFAMSDLLDAIIPIIESEETTSAFDLSLSEVIGPEYVENGYDPEEIPPNLPRRYTISNTFIFRSANLDPIHLYPSEFVTRTGNRNDQIEQKLAGYSMTAIFDSPEIQENYSPIQCKPLFDTSEGSSDA